MTPIPRAHGRDLLPATRLDRRPPARARARPPAPTAIAAGRPRPRRCSARSCSRPPRPAPSTIPRPVPLLHGCCCLLYPPHPPWPRLVTGPHRLARSLPCSGTPEPLYPLRPSACARVRARRAGPAPWPRPQRRPCRGRSSLRPPLFHAPSQSPSFARLAPGEPRRGHQPPCSGDLPAPPAPVVRPKERVLGTVAPAPVRATTTRPCARNPQGPLGPMTWGPQPQNVLIKKRE